MPKCPSCKKEVKDKYKTWKYGRYDVNAYQCTCGTKFNDYYHIGEKKFTLMKKANAGKLYRKVP